MWTVMYYMPVTIFSLKPAVATSSGGKTLICPTPFSIKMALLDAAIRTQGKETGQQWWNDIRGMRLQIALPAALSVVNTFTRIVRPRHGGPKDDDGTGLITPLGRTIAYREYVSYGDRIGLAAQMASGDHLPQPLANLFLHISYLGKRGGFVQLLDPPVVCEATALMEAQGWIVLTEDQTRFDAGGTLQMLDDCGDTMTFEHANIYSSKRIVVGKERVLRHIVLPYRLARSSRGYSLYRRIAYSEA